MDTVEWETRPGDSWEVSPPADLGFGYAIVLEPGGTAADWVRCPPNMPGYEDLAGTKLYYDEAFTMPEGKLVCPICGNRGPHRAIRMRDYPIVVVECMGGERFHFVEMPAR